MPLTVRISDITECTDVAIQGSPDIVVNGLPIHRRTDATGGHGCWPPNAALTGSGDTFDNGLPDARVSMDVHIGHACVGFHQTRYSTGSPDTVVN